MGIVAIVIVAREEMEEIGERVEIVNVVHGEMEETGERDVVEETANGSTVAVREGERVDRKVVSRGGRGVASTR